jgi:hypothetical protein
MLSVESKFLVFTGFLLHALPTPQPRLETFSIFVGLNSTGY